MTNRYNAMSLWTLLSAWAGFAPAAKAVAVLPSALPAVLPQPEQMQWAKISHFMSGAGRSAARAIELQRSSAQQLDAASYALDILKSELAAAMTMKAAETAVVLTAPQPRPLRSIKRKVKLAA